MTVYIMGPLYANTLRTIHTNRPLYDSAMSVKVVVDGCGQCVETRRPLFDRSSDGLKLRDFEFIAIGKRVTYAKSRRAASLVERGMHRTKTRKKNTK